MQDGALEEILDEMGCEFGGMAGQSRQFLGQQAAVFADALQMLARGDVAVLGELGQGEDSGVFGLADAAQRGDQFAFQFLADADIAQQQLQTQF